MPGEVAAEILTSGGLADVDDELLASLRTYVGFEASLRGLPPMPSDRRPHGYREPVDEEKVEEVMADVERRFHVLFDVVPRTEQELCANCRGGRRFKNRARCRACRGRGWVKKSPTIGSGPSS